MRKVSQSTLTGRRRCGELLSASAVVAVVQDVVSRRNPVRFPIHLRTPLPDLGLDSLDLAEIVIALEDSVGRSCEFELPDRLQTVGDLLELIATFRHEGGR